MHSTEYCIHSLLTKICSEEKGTCLNSGRAPVEKEWYSGSWLFLNKLIVYLLSIDNLKNKNAQCESWELSFIWEQNENYCPRDSISVNSKKLLQRGKVSIYVNLVKGEYMQLNIYFSRRFLLFMKNSHHYEGFYCFSGYEEIKKIGLIKSVHKNIYLKTCSANFPQSTKCLISAFHPELLSGFVQNQQLQQHVI